jgi:hypothetical protein
MVVRASLAVGYGLVMMQACGGRAAQALDITEL